MHQMVTEYHNVEQDMRVYEIKLHLPEYGISYVREINRFQSDRVIQFANRKMEDHPVHPLYQKHLERDWK